jgi:hypothetical protein
VQQDQRRPQLYAESAPQAAASTVLYLHVQPRRHLLQQLLDGRLRICNLVLADHVIDPDQPARAHADPRPDADAIVARVLEALGPRTAVARA